MPNLYRVDKYLPRFFDQVGHQTTYAYTLESGIDEGQGITIGPGKFFKKNKRRALNKRRA